MYRVLCGLGISLALAGTAPADPPPVINLKPLLDTEKWVLDITYTARKTYDDRDYTAELEMTATARYVLTRVDRSAASGHWQAQECHSHNLTYRAFRYNKHYAPDRLEYSAKRSGAMVAPLADLHVGGFTPGYSLLVSGGFPAQLTTGSGLQDHPLVLSTQVKDAPGLSGMLSGPLPGKGTLISGTKVIPAEIPPFLANQPGGPVQMSIQFTLSPPPLQPLTP